MNKKLFLLFFSLLLMVGVFSGTYHNAEAAPLRWSNSLMIFSPDSRSPKSTSIMAPTSTELSSYLSEDPASSGPEICNGYGYGYYDTTYPFDGDGNCSSALGSGSDGYIAYYPTVINDSTGSSLSVELIIGSSPTTYRFKVPASGVPTENTYIYFTGQSDAKSTTGVGVSIKTFDATTGALIDPEYYINKTFTISFRSIKYQWTWNSPTILTTYGGDSWMDSPFPTFKITTTNNLTASPEYFCVANDVVNGYVETDIKYNNQNLTLPQNLSVSIPSTLISSFEKRSVDGVTVLRLYIKPNVTGDNNIHLTYEFPSNTSNAVSKDISITVKPAGEPCGVMPMSGASSITFNPNESVQENYSVPASYTGVIWNSASWVGTPISGVTIQSPLTQQAPIIPIPAGCPGFPEQTRINSGNGFFSMLKGTFGNLFSRVFADVVCTETVYPLGNNQTLKINSSGVGLINEALHGVIKLQAWSNSGTGDQAIKYVNITVNPQPSYIAVYADSSSIIAVKNGPTVPVTVHVEPFNISGIINLTNNIGTYNLTGTDMPLTCPNTGCDFTFNLGAGTASVPGPHIVTISASGSGTGGIVTGFATISVTVQNSALINGSCSNPPAHYNCSTGTSANHINSTYSYSWNCNGSNGGTNASCVESKPFPDLTAAAPTPSSAVSGVPTVFSSAIWNNGNIITPTYFYNVIQVSTTANGANPSSPVLANPNPMPALDGGAMSNTASATRTFTSGTPSIRFCADKNASWAGRITESNSTTPPGTGETNNCSPWVNINVTPAPAPDLTIGAVTYTPPVYVGAAKTFSANITNQGTVSTGIGFQYKFQWDNDSNHTSGVTDISASTTSLSGQTSRMVSRSITFLTSGTKYVRACADLPPSPNGVVPEGTNEGNNCSGTWTVVTVLPAPIYPDLTADTVTYTAPVYVGVAKTFTSNIHNQSTVGTGVGFNNIFQITDDPNQSQTRNNNPFSASKVQAAFSDSVVIPMGALAPWAVDDANFPYTFNTVGTYYIRVCADLPPYPNGGIPEGTNEGNNCSQGGWIAITVINAPLPDLTAGAVTPITAVINTSTTFSAMITNQGTGSTGSEFTNKLQVSLNSNGSNATTYPTTTMSALSAGGSAIAYKSLTFGSTANRYIRFCADLPPDPNGVIAESNENNNCGPWTTITVSPSSTYPTVISPTTSNISTTSATLGAMVSSNGGVALSDRGTCYATVSWVAPNPTENPNESKVAICASEDQVLPVAVGVFSHSRSGLSPNTTYYYRGYATNINGTGYSNQDTFTTLAGIVPSGTLTATTCSIANNASTCNSKVDWTTANLPPLTLTAVTRNNPDNTPVGNGPSGTATSVVNFGDSTFYLYNNGVELDSYKINVGCVSGTYWDDITKPAKCKTITPTPYMMFFNADPACIVSGGSSTLSWGSGNTDSCTASGGWSGKKDTSGSYEVTPSTSTTYSISCDDGVTTTPTVSVEVKVMTTCGGGGGAGGGKTPGYIEN